ncbi:MAG: peptidylprolyl isomerase [Geobacter sp.]|nr:MAG: peptidylprolyl isomerase [Geobacter sp.]
MKAALLVLCIAVACGCNGKTGTGESKGSSGGKTLAEVNGNVITTEDFKREVENLPPYLKPMADTAEGKKEMLDTMIVRDLILQQARKDGIDKSAEVTAKLEDLKKRVVVEAYLKKKVEEQAGLSDADLQKFYDANKDKFKTGEQIRASHILVKSEKEAQDILAQLKKGGNFEELAKKYSTDSAGAKGGDLGWFGKGSMIPAFEKVAFGLKEGELSGIVTTQFGYHIIKLTGKRPAGIRPFAEVKDQIKAGLLPEKQQEVFKKLKEDLKKNAKISVKEDVLNELGGKKSPETAAPPTETKPK